MARKRTLATALLAAALLAAAPLLAAAAETGDAGDAPPEEESSGKAAGLAGLGTRDDSDTDRGPGGPKLGRNGDADDTFPALLGQSLAAVLVVLVLGGVALFVAKRFLPRLGVGQGRRISILETVYVGPRKSLHLVEIGDRTLLLAGTRERLSLVTDLTGSVESEGRSLSSSDGSGGTFVPPTRRPPGLGEDRDA